MLKMEKNLEIWNKFITFAVGKLLDTEEELQYSRCTKNPPYQQVIRRLNYYL